MKRRPPLSMRTSVAIGSNEHHGRRDQRHKYVWGGWLQQVPIVCATRSTCWNFLPRWSHNHRQSTKRNLQSKALPHSDVKRFTLDADRSAAERLVIGPEPAERRDARRSKAPCKQRVVNPQQQVHRNCLDCYCQPQAEEEAPRSRGAVCEFPQFFMF